MTKERFHFMPLALLGISMLIAVGSLYAYSANSRGIPNANLALTSSSLNVKSSRNGLASISFKYSIGSLVEKTSTNNNVVAQNIVSNASLESISLGHTAN
ncbi:MAG: hypothetical protein ACYCPS_03760 [Candidatus Saccharimonadales bacterium]